MRLILFAVLRRWWRRLLCPHPRWMKRWGLAWHLELGLQEWQCEECGKTKLFDRHEPPINFVDPSEVRS